MKKEILARALQYIDSWLAFRATRVDIPGWVVAITHQNKVVFNKAYGYAQLDNKEELTTNHLFRVASHSKSFAAVSILQLAEQGKLTLDDPIIKHLSWLEGHDDPRMKVVTIRQVLSHSAGITRDGDDCNFWEATKPFPSKKELKRIVRETNLLCDTNIEMKYSNFGYGLVGMIIESISGLSFDQYIQKHICRPIGLKNTGSGRLHEEIVDRLVTGYSRRDLGLRRPISKTMDTLSLDAATGCYSTTAELNAFYCALDVGTNQLLNDESKKTMRQALWNARWYDEFREYGLGIQIEHINDHKLYGHGGGFPGHRTFTGYDPEAKLSISLFVNAIDIDPRFITKGIWSVIDFFASNYVKKPDIDATKFEGRFMCLWYIADIVVWGNKIVSVSPDSWYPLCDTEELEYVDDQTLKVVVTDGYSSKYELLKYDFDKKGEVKSIDYTGRTILPEKEYLKSLQN
jgi:CubicO group peptidase (beta-lactamase class C family)